MVDICDARDGGQCSPRKKLLQAQQKDRALRDEDTKEDDDGGGGCDDATPVLNQKPSFGASLLSAADQKRLQISLPNHCDTTPRLARQVSETYVRGLMGEAQAKAVTARGGQDACK